MILEVTLRADHIFECVVQGACGSPTCGRGHTVAEAVGDWTVQSGHVTIICKPPHLLERYKTSFEPIGERN